MSVRLLRTFLSVLIIAALTGLGGRLIPVNATTIGFVYLSAIVLMAMAWGLTESIAASIAAVLSLNYYFLPPIGTFTIEDPANWVALFAFLMTSVIISELSVRAQREAQAALTRRAEMEQLYSFSRSILLSDASTEPIGDQIVRNLAQVFDCAGAALLDSASGAIHYGGPDSLESEAAGLRAAALHGVAVERSAETPVQIFAVSLGGRPIGSAAVKGLGLSEPAIESLANLIAIGLERSRTLQTESKAEAARQSEELKSTLLDAIAHEFKTPLTSIKAAASGLLSVPLGASERELATIVEEEADRLNVLVSQTIRMSRIEAGKVRLERRVVDPVEVVRSALSQLGSRTEDRTVSIEAAGAVQPASLDPDLFAIAVRQALDNALKYSRVIDPVEVVLSEPEGELLVEVRDHGPGIPAGEQAQVFEKFYRGVGTAKQVPGSGMGLSIAREIVELHGGRAWIDSKPGRGVSFFAAIPR